MKIIRRGQEARDSLKRGVDLVADCIKVTIGPSGRNAVLGRLDITPVTTNDGATIARNIEAEDEIENQGVWMVKEACQITDNGSGDGTTTTTILLQEIVNEGFLRIKDDGSLVKNTVDTIKLKKEVDMWCDVVVEKLTQLARPITEDDLCNVALTSGEYSWLAEMVTEIFKKIGKDGYVTLEDGNVSEYEIFKGIELKAGYHSNYYVNEGDKCVLEKPLILVTNQPLEISAITKLFDVMVSQETTKAIIIAPDFTKDSLARLTTTKLKAGLDIVALKLPTLGDDNILIDVATVTDAKFLDKNAYAKYEQFTEDIVLENLGTVGKAIIGETKSVLMDGQGDTEARIKEIRTAIGKTLSQFDKDKLEQRIAFLSGGIAVLRIGGESETEQKYYRLKAEDAVNAVQVALRDGVVPGGGLALKTIAESLEDNILTKALVAPYNQIQKNAGGELVIKDSVIDPVKTTISALKSACSLAGMILTTEVVTAYKNDPKNKDAS